MFLKGTALTKEQDNFRKESIKKTSEIMELIKDNSYSDAMKKLQEKNPHVNMQEWGPEQTDPIVLYIISKLRKFFILTEYIGTEKVKDGEDFSGTNVIVSVHSQKLGIKKVSDLFWDKTNRSFYDTGIDHESLIVRPINFQDNAIPSGSAIAADILLKLAVITGRKEFEKYGQDALKSSIPMLTQYPLGAGHWLCVLDFYLDKPKEIVVVGKSESYDTKELVAEVFRHYIPNRVFVGNDIEDGTLGNLPILHMKNLVDGRATAFVCENYVCALPSLTPESFAKQLSI